MFWEKTITNFLTQEKIKKPFALSARHSRRRRWVYRRVIPIIF